MDIKNRLKIIIPIISLLLTSSSLAQKNENLEPLYGLQLVDNQLVVQVNSNGCTVKEHFVIHKQYHEGEYQLRIIRTKKDYCRAMPKVVFLSLPIVLKATDRYNIRNHFILKKRVSMR